MMLTLKSSPKTCFCFIFWYINEINEKTWSVIISSSFIYVCTWKGQIKNLNRTFGPTSPSGSTLLRFFKCQVYRRAAMIPWYLWDATRWQKQLQCTYCNRPSLLSLFITSVQHTHTHIDTHVNTITPLACNNGQLNDSHLWVISWAELLASTGIQDTNTLTMAREKIVT